MKPERSLAEACEEVENIIREHKQLKLQCEDLKMVCRRLVAAQSLETRDKIAEQCRHLFCGDPLKTAGLNEEQEA